MAAGRTAAPRRAQTLTNVQTISPHPKPSITVEEWETKAPLSAIATRSTIALKKACEEKPLPLKFSEDESALAGPSRPSTPANNHRMKLGFPSSPSRPVTPSNVFKTASKTHHPLHPKQPVQTPQQFYDWFALVDRSVAHSQEAHFRAHLDSVSEHLQTCENLSAQVMDIEVEVEGMLEGWRGVEEGGKSLKDACEKLLEERDRLLELTESIGERLEYFQELEHATRMLNHPGESLVLQHDFLYMVERVDICIEYLRDHRHFREAEVYLLRFQQCLTRAMTLIKMYFVGSLKALTTDVSRRLSEKDVSHTAQMHLLYTRFTSISASLSPLLGELERRARAHPDDLSSLLSECYAAYFTSRKGLLIGRLTEEIKGLDPVKTELVELTRAGCSYLKQLCTDEFNLYREFFTSGEDQLYQYLENLCDYLYDDLRPRILHEQRLSALCEVCTVLQALMVLDTSDPDSSVDSDSDDADELSTSFDRSRPKGFGKLHISHLLQMVLQDAQTRLFFKAQAVVQSEIRYYVPKPDDLAYPDKLVVARKPVVGMEPKEKEAVSRLFIIPSMDVQDTWYPTLRKTVWVLSQLHDFVKPAIFEDIAQEALSLCQQSLTAAAEIIQVKTNTLDAHLFLVRHMLIMKEIIANLELEHVGEAALNLPAVSDTFTSMMKGTSYLLPSALFASLGMPGSSTTTSMLDAKQSVDYELKRSCEEVISQCFEPITQPLHAWVDRIHAQMRGEHKTDSGYSAIPPEPLTANEWAQQPVAEELNSNFRHACEHDLRAAVVRMRLYLEDDRTVSALLRHVRERIEDDYGGFRDVVWNMYAGAMKGQALSREQLADLLDAVCQVET